MPYLLTVTGHPGAEGSTYSQSACMVETREELERLVWAAALDASGLRLSEQQSVALHAIALAQEIRPATDRERWRLLCQATGRSIDLPALATRIGPALANRGLITMSGVRYGPKTYRLSDAVSRLRQVACAARYEIGPGGHGVDQRGVEVRLPRTDLRMQMVDVKRLREWGQRNGMGSINSDAEIMAAYNALAGLGLAT